MRRSASSSAVAGSPSGESIVALPSAAVIAKPSPLSLSAAGADREIRVLARRHRRQDAEFVAAHAIREAAPVDRARQRAAEPGQEGVAGRMAVDVVVGLEAVEVEEQQQERALRRRVDDLLGEVVGERPPVAQPGQRVGRRLAAARAEQRHVLPERQPQPHAGDAERREGEAGRQVADLLEVVDEQQRERREHRRQREHEQPAAFELQGARLHDRLPRGERGQQR
jgi:hypothetical protein